MVDIVLKMTNEDSTNPLNVKTKIGYAAGHILNDIAVVLTSTYMMLFLQTVLGIEKTNVGIIILIGQIVDGLTSPIIGFLSDLNNDLWLCNKYGRRKVSLQMN